MKKLDWLIITTIFTVGYRFEELRARRNYEHSR